jgi:hypothetical protein
MQHAMNLMLWICEIMKRGIESVTMRKRRLTMAPKLEEKSASSLEEMTIERGIRDGSINWMVVAATSSWRSGDYSKVLINYFGEKAAMDEGGTVEKNVNRFDGPTGERRGPAQKMGNVGPAQNLLKRGRWLWLRKVQRLQPRLGFEVSAVDVRCYGARAKILVWVEG